MAIPISDKLSGFKRSIYGFSEVIVLLVSARVSPIDIKDQILHDYILDFLKNVSLLKLSIPKIQILQSKEDENSC